MKIRAVCSDIDGTLLDSRRQLSARTIEAVRKISGYVPVILASSRMPSAMRHLQAELGIEDQPLICFNGGYVICYDAGSPVVLDSVKLPGPIARSIIGLVSGTSIHTSFFVDDRWYTALSDQWTERESTITKVSPTLVEFDEIPGLLSDAPSGLHKIMCMGPEPEIEAIYTVLQRMFFDEIHIYRSKSTYLEIAPKTISKATALAMIMRRMYNGSLSDVMAFGDNCNDVDMIRFAGLGIAVDNAIPEVKAVAKELTLGSKEDGVAVALEKYFS